MREAPPYAPEPDTLLALVGTSPTPPLLSALTFRPRRLVLAHSSNTERRAGHIREVLEGWPNAPTTELHDLGPEVFDFHTVQARLKELFTKLGPDGWRLCYTGGTKVMALSAVLAHLEKFPEKHQHEWRSYLDVHRDTFAFTNGRTRAVAPGAVDLKIDDLATLHGVRLTQKPVKKREAMNEGELFEAEVQAWLHGTFGGLSGWEVRGNVVVVDAHLGVRGKEQPVAELDAVVRRGHRLLCAEAKKGWPAILDAAGWAAAAGQRTFGSATSTLLVHKLPEEEGRNLPEEVQAYHPQLSGGGFQVRRFAQLKRGGTDPEKFAKKYLGAKRPRPETTEGELPDPRSAAPQHPGLKDAPLLLMAVGGSGLGIPAAVTAHRPGRVVLAYSHESDRRTGQWKRAAIQALFAVENPDRPFGSEPDSGYSERVSALPRPVGSEDVPGTAAAVGEWIRGYEGPVIADVTTATKAMSLGLTAVARSYGGCATYLSPVTRRVDCHAHGEVGWVPPVAVDWEAVLPGRTRLAEPEMASFHSQARRWVDAELLCDAARSACAELRRRHHEPEVWADDTALLAGAADDRRYSMIQRPTLIVAAADRALGLAAPAPKGSTTKWVHAAFAATKAMEVKCGAAARQLVLCRPETGGRWTERVEELRRFVAWQKDLPVDPDERAAEDIADHEEMYRPEVCESDPGSAKLRDVLVQCLDSLHLGPRC